MIVRRWSDWVVAAYSDEPGNPFGGQAIYVADRRETGTAQGNPCDSNAGSWDNDGGPTAARTTAGPDRNPLTQQGERL